MMNIPCGEGNEIDLSELVAAVVSTASRVLREFSAESSPEQIKNGNDLVTEADRRIEDQLGAVLWQLLPGSSVAGEERADHSPGSESEYRWVVDPIDGTIDFARGYEFYTTVVCLLDAKGPMISVVYQPPSDVVTTAVRNGECLQWKHASSGVADRAPERTLRVGEHAWEESIHSLMLTPKLAAIPRRSLLDFASSLLDETLGVRVLVSQAYEALKLAEGGVTSVVSLQSSGGWTRDAVRLLCETAGGVFASVACVEDTQIRGFVLAEDRASLERIAGHLVTVGYQTEL